MFLVVFFTSNLVLLRFVVLINNDVDAAVYLRGVDDYKYAHGCGDSPIDRRLIQQLLLYYTRIAAAAVVEIIFDLQHRATAAAATANRPVSTRVTQACGTYYTYVACFFFF